MADQAFLFLLARQLSENLQLEAWAVSNFTALLNAVPLHARSSHVFALVIAVGFYRYLFTAIEAMARLHIFGSTPMGEVRA